MTPALPALKTRLRRSRGVLVDSDAFRYRPYYPGVEVLAPGSHIC
jgi:hypothetical protein